MTTSRKEFFLPILPWTICIAYAGLYFSIPISNATIIALLVSSLLVLTINDIKQAIRSSLPVQLLILFYLIHLPGLLYTDNMQAGLFELEKKLTLLLFPLFLFPAIQLLPSQQKTRTIIWIGFITMAASLLFVGVALAKLIIAHNDMAFDREYFASIPYVFFSIYFATGSLLLLNECYNKWHSTRNGLLVMSGIVVYSLGILVVVASKAGLLAYVLGLTYFLFQRIASRRKFVITLFAVTAAVAALLFFHPVTLNRFIELRNNLSVLKQDKITDVTEFTGLNLRLYFWKIGSSQLWEEGRVIAGVGTGDGQDLLNKAYLKHNLDQYGYLGFDPHNQWVMTLLQLGLVGVIILGSVFVTGLWVAQKFKNINYNIFIWIIFCFSLSETILESNKAIVFFALLFCLLSGASDKQDTEAEISVSV